MFARGGKQRAVAQLRRHFSLKYTPCDPPPPDLPLRILAADASVPSPPLISVKEIRDVLDTCKAGKSCGRDGISFEFLVALMCSDLAQHFADFLNSVLFGTAPLPDSWLVSQLTFIPKNPLPSEPKHLRPIVLSSTPGKLFTKILLFRLRPHFPPPVANQLACIPGCQTLDGSACLQHLVHISQEYRLPLLAIKLDVASAFDHLSHSAIAHFLAQCGPHLESHVLLRIIVLSRVLIGISDSSWEQKLLRGIVQGSSYSAEIFARTVDFFLGSLVALWHDTEPTWIQSTNPDGLHRHLYNLLFADDIVLLATSYEQAKRMLDQVIDTLSCIGLSLALEKCKFIASPDLGDCPLVVRNIIIPRVASFLFLGVLIGYGISCQAVLTTRLALTQNSYWGYYQILRRPGASIRTRLSLLNSFVTSKWRWLSPCLRPTTNVCNILKIMHTTFLTSLCGLPPDPFVSSSANWITRRRASRMIAQAVGHKSWHGIQASSFFGYWAHAARIFKHRLSPITIAIHVRDNSWLLRFGNVIKRQRGFGPMRPNAYRFLQLAYQRFRSPLDPASWEQKALDKSGWLEFTFMWLHNKNLEPHLFYPSLPEVDLLGRCLLQIGDRFKLLPFRHVPVEPPYGTSYEVVPEVHFSVDTALIQVCSDGGSKSNEGSIAVTLLAPYASLEEAVIFQQKIPRPCSNNKAELLAGIAALKHIRTVLSFYPHIPFVYMTDSMLVLQALEEYANVTCHPHVVHELVHLWRQLCKHGKAVHVKGHAGHPQNTLTDKAATEALGFTHFRRVHRNCSYTKVYMTQDQHAVPSFQEWM